MAASDDNLQMKSKHDAFRRWQLKRLGYGVVLFLLLALMWALAFDAFNRYIIELPRMLRGLLNTVVGFLIALRFVTVPLTEVLFNGGGDD